MAMTKPKTRPMPKLMPLLLDFLARYPKVELDIDFNDRIVDLIEEGVGLAIRSGDLPNSQLVSLPLRHYRLMLCASPPYLARRGVPQTIDDLADHDGIRFRFPHTGQLQTWPLNTLADAVAPEPTWRLRGTLVLNNMEAVRSAALGGLGIACMPDFLVQQPLERGELCALLALDPRPAGRFRAVWPTSRHLSPKVRVFVDFLKGRLRDDDARAS